MVNTFAMICTILIYSYTLSVYFYTFALDTAIIVIAFIVCFRINPNMLFLS